MQAWPEERYTIKDPPGWDPVTKTFKKGPSHNNSLAEAPDQQVPDRLQSRLGYASDSSIGDGRAGQTVAGAGLANRRLQQHPGYASDSGNGGEEPRQARTAGRASGQLQSRLGGASETSSERPTSVGQAGSRLEGRLAYASDSGTGVGRPQQANSANSEQLNRATADMDLNRAASTGNNAGPTVKRRQILTEQLDAAASVPGNKRNKIVFQTEQPQAAVPGNKRSKIIFPPSEVKSTANASLSTDQKLTMSLDDIVASQKAVKQRP